MPCRCGHEVIVRRPLTIRCSRPVRAGLRPPARAAELRHWASNMRMFYFVAAMLPIFGSAYAADTNKSLSEEALLAYASAPFDRVDKQIVSLGQLNGTPVIAEFICSDVCPDYTVRVIRYNLKNDQTCSGVDGVEKALRIPVGIAATDKKFCFPKVLANNWTKYQKKLSYVPSGVGPHE